MDINSLKKPELVDYAGSLGIEVGARDTVEEIKLKIAAANGTDVAPTGDDMDQSLAKVKPKNAKDDGEQELTVIFHPGPNQETGNVYFGINGVAMSLPRNKEVKVKKKYLDMLSQEAIGYTVSQVLNSQTGEIEETKVKKPTYTFQIVG